MDQQVKQQWVDALRSEKYAQHQGALASARGDSYCVLGVLCHLAVEAGVPGIKEDDEPGWHRFAEYDEDFGWEEVEGFPTDAVVEWAGLDSHSPEVVHNGEYRPISVWNDDGEFTFQELADIIERQL